MNCVTTRDQKEKSKGDGIGTAQQMHDDDNNSSRSKRQNITRQTHYNK